jgi:Domain of unknown function (DUF4384)
MKKAQLPSVLCVIVAGFYASFALAQSEDASRGVRIIEGAPTSAGPVPALPPGEPPAGAGPSGSEPIGGLPSLGVPAVRPPAPSPNPGDFKISNSAEVGIEIVPGQDLTVGSRVSFRISTKRAGYLILVDVDPNGKLTQIYPNPMSLMTGGNRQNANYVRPGKPIQVPNSSDPYAGFEFIASPPYGSGVVVAFLSDVPVQKVDLPDIPTSLAGQASALAYLTKVAGELRILQGDSTIRLQEARWSFDAKFYSIR